VGVLPGLCALLEALTELGAALALPTGVPARGAAARHARTFLDTCYSRAFPVVARGARHAHTFLNLCVAREHFCAPPPVRGGILVEAHEQRQRLRELGDVLPEPRRAWTGAALPSRPALPCFL
jgi:hypothetical protein